MVATTGAVAAFDGEKLIQALDERRCARGLTWTALAGQLWEQSAVLNARLGGDALCPGALYRTSLRGTMSCQYALPLLRWLGRPPEDFLVGEPAEVGDAALPEAGPDRRLRFDLAALHAAVDQRRHERGLTWAALGRELGCTPNRLTNLRTARLADMALVMRITQSLGEPAARFVHATDW
ncbi:MAG: hypothetical protein U0Q15_00550 [Kineosporiaceae bacterium]